MFCLSIKKIILKALKLKDMRGVILFITILAISSCLDIKEEFTGLPPGTWRAELRLGPNPYPVYDEDAVRERRTAVFEGVKDDVLPFLMEVSYPQKDSFVIDIINGEERIRVSEYSYGLDRRTAHDTIRIEFPAYNSYIKAEFVEEVLQGEFIKRDAKNYSIPFVAKHGVDYRFKQPDSKPEINISGRWDVTFQTADGNSWKAIGEFDQDSTELNGTFMTKTGDYRFLAGAVFGDKMWLSTFDGTHAYLFGAKLIEGDTLQGFYKSGTHFSASWKATRNEELELESADSLTRVIEAEGIATLEGHLPSTGEVVSLSSPKYENKAIILSIMGTWCPNCRDEMEFLREWSKSEKPDDIEIVGLAFERPADTSRVYQKITKYKRIMDIPFDIWYMGTSDKQKASERLPMLNEVISYPTMIFLTADREVVRVHTGFAGPATSKYDDFVSSFHETIKKLR